MMALMLECTTEKLAYILPIEQAKAMLVYNSKVNISQNIHIIEKEFGESIDTNLEFYLKIQKNYFPGQKQLFHVHSMSVIGITRAVSMK